MLNASGRQDRHFGLTKLVVEAFHVLVLQGVPAVEQALKGLLGGITGRRGLGGGFGIGALEDFQEPGHVCLHGVQVGRRIGGGLIPSPSAASQLGVPPN